MLPLEILKGTKNKKIMVQIKNGDYINGILENVDFFMNLKIKDIIYNNKEGTNFFKAKEIFIRGSNISAINFEENLLAEIAKEKETQKQIPIINDSSIPKNENSFLNKKRYEHGAYRGRGGNMSRGRGRGMYKK